MRSSIRVAACCLCAIGSVAPAAADQPWKSVSRGSPSLPRPGGDLLLLRDGTRMTGTLTGCGGTACRFNNLTVDRGRIEWIGLAGAVLPPPQLDDPTADAVFLSGGEVRKESLVGVNAHEVVTDAGSYPRGDVRWIHLAPPGGEARQPQATPTVIVAATPPEGGNDAGGPEATPPAATPPPPTAPPPTAAPPTPPPGNTPGPPPTRPPHRTPPPPAGGTPQPGGLWTGVVRGRWWGTKAEARTELKFRAQVRLREFSYPLYGITPETVRQRIGTMIRLEPEGTELTAEFHQSGDWGSCDGHGTTTLSYALTESGVDHPSVIYLKIVETDFTRRLGFDVPRRGGVYRVALPTRNDDKFPAECRTAGGVSTQMEAYIVPVLGRSPLGPHTIPFEDPELRSLSDGDRRMGGHFTAPAVGAFDHVEVGWTICKEGVQCIEGGGPGPSGDDCPQTTEADSRVETNRAKYEAYAKDIAGRWGKYQRQMEEARSHLHDFEVTMRVCNVQNWVGTVLLALLAPEGEAAEALEQALAKDPLAALTPEEEEALIKGGLKQVADMVDKIVKGENPFTTMLPENVQTAMELFGVASKLAAAMQGTTAEKLGESLEECAGTAGITQSQYSSAEEYVSGLKAAVEQLAEIQSLVNDVKQLDNQLPDLQYQAYRVCVERARCQGKPDTSCDGLKPPGDWPPVP